MGGTHVIIKKFEPATFFDLVTRERVTFACMPPTMINMALNHPLSDEALAEMPREVRVGTAGSARRSRPFRARKKNSAGA